MTHMGDAISSGKLSQAWSSGSTAGSWMTTDYSKMNTSNELLSSSDVNAQEYEAEWKKMQPHFTPLVWGMSCSILTLFSLRAGKWYHGRKLGGVKVKSNVNSVKDAGVMKDAGRIQDLRRSRPKDYATYTETNPFQNKTSDASTNSSMENLLSLPVDLAISLLFGISTTIFLSAPSILLKDLSEAPLLPGRSILSEELCEPFTQEMECVNSNVYTYDISSGGRKEKGVVSFGEIWEEDNLGEFDSLRAVRNFVRNCRERERREKSNYDDVYSHEE